MPVVGRLFDWCTGPAPGSCPPLCCPGVFILPTPFVIASNCVLSLPRLAFLSLLSVRQHQSYTHTVYTRFVAFLSGETKRKAARFVKFPIWLTRSGRFCLDVHDGAKQTTNQSQVLQLKCDSLVCCSASSVSNHEQLSVQYVWPET